ncbi:hypothetical protein [Haloplasma contractile]|uniref:Uncharacterized protein n=1 Tax=Haloplasma contractile SSD-17B TaxID=1033810 RepID=F7PV00_9MOLU|nr:hypothetical protein [Haloplasma contractile]ERJ11235.1 hypothetical protein HLPCO_002675 [Haloplasma contractile SSD-17B]
MANLKSHLLKKHILNHNIIDVVLTDLEIQQEVSSLKIAREKYNNAQKRRQFIKNGNDYSNSSIIRSLK